MLMTYKAKLNGDRIEWSDEIPPSLNGGTADVLVTVLITPEGVPVAEADLRRRRVAALERIAARGEIMSIPDPVAWQQELREDRPLPGRE